jgi:hypothetical protein
MQVELRSKELLPLGVFVEKSKTETFWIHKAEKTCENNGKYGVQKPADDVFGELFGDLSERIHDLY